MLSEHELQLQRVVDKLAATASSAAKAAAEMQIDGIDRKRWDEFAGHRRRLDVLSSALGAVLWLDDDDDVD